MKLLKLALEKLTLFNALLNPSKLREWRSKVREGKSRTTNRPRRATKTAESAFTT